jgi:hypothetical protein
VSTDDDGKKLDARRQSRPLSGAGCAQKRERERKQSHF